MKMCAKEFCIGSKPDFSRLEKVLRREGTSDRVPFFELFSDIEADVLRAIGKWMDDTSDDLTKSEKEAVRLRNHITYMESLGYDFVNFFAKGFEFPRNKMPTAMNDGGEREYHQANSFTIASREDFEKYPWPDMSQADYSLLETVGEQLPEGMKVIASFSGILENAMWLLGFEGISLLAYDDERLVYDMLEAVGTRIIEYFDRCASYEIVGAVQMGEDMGFKTQTMLSPDMLRKYAFPWHRKLVDAVHRHGKPVILHSCGNLSQVMDEIIECGWDAKHSFEDAIEPVWETKAKYGDRIALLGGFDMDKICRMTQDEVRKHTRFLIEKCGPGGGWAFGTGNSVANYVPVDNFLTMLDEGCRAGWY